MAKNQSDSGWKKLSVHLIVDQEPLPLVVKEALRQLWHKFRVIRVARAKDNTYTITIGKEELARCYSKATLGR
ncbi:hypothetical protein ACFX13_038576 [Malus domestica]